MTVTARPYVKDGIELDQIAVEGIRVAGTHGVNPNERETGQLFYADVVVHVNTRNAGAGDDLSKTVNYSDLADRAAEVLAGSPFQLIEAVADHIAREVLDFDGVECVDVTVHKPQAPLHVEFKDVTISIRRDMRDGGLWADKRIGSSAGYSDDPRSPEGSHAPRDIMDERPAQPVGAVIALGGNLGDVEPTFREALAELGRVGGVTVGTVSPLVRSVPEGGVDQPDYLNAVVRIETSLSPRELLAACQGIEMVHGRDRSVPGAARTLDLDIVAFDGVTGEADDLVLPHPRAHQRGFVLLPWVAMENDAVLEPHGSVADIARAAQFQGVSLVSAQWPQVPAPDALPDAPEADGGAESGEAVQESVSEAGAAVADVPEMAPEEPAAASVPEAPAAPAYSAPEQPSAPPVYSAPEATSAPAPVSAPSAAFQPAPAEPTPAASAPEPASAPQTYSAPQSYSAPQTYSAPPAPSAPEAPSAPQAAAPTSPYDGPVSPYAGSAPAAAAPPSFDDVLAEPQSSAPPAPQTWARVSDQASAASAPTTGSAPAAPSAPQTGTTPTRASFGVARQTPPPAPESDDDAAS